MKQLRLIILFSVLTSTQGYCCVCRYLSKTEELENRIKSSSNIFTGRVIGIEFVQTNIKDEFDRNQYLIKVKFLLGTKFKGDMLLDTIEVFQENSNCQFQFQFNKKYLVYTYNEEGTEYTNQCTPTVSINDAEVHYKILYKIYDSKQNR